MSIRVGDGVFTRVGQPGVVIDRNETTGALKLETELPKVQQSMRHGYINGLSPERRQEFYEILDQVKTETQDPKERVLTLNEKINELDADPRNLQLVRYLRSEMRHIMITHNILPNEYTVHEAKAR